MRVPSRDCFSLKRGGERIRTLPGKVKMEGGVLVYLEKIEPGTPHKASLLVNFSVRMSVL